MKNQSIILVIFCLLLTAILSGCGGYVKKDEIEKRLSDQRMDMENKIQLAQDAAIMANSKSDKALSAAKGMDNMKQEILSDADARINSAMVSMKSRNDDEATRIAQDVSNKALFEAKAFLLAEDEKIKQLAKEASDEAMKAAIEAEKKAMEASELAELAKELPLPKVIAIYTVYFDPGKTNLKAEGIAELEKVAIAIRENPDIIVNIEGHTDNTPVVYSKYRNNWSLSQARANTVKEYLVANLEIPESSVKNGIGFAEYKPNASNDPGNRWQNRRTDIIITR